MMARRGRGLAHRPQETDQSEGHIMMAKMEINVTCDPVYEELMRG